MLVRLMCVECGAPGLDGRDASLTCARCGASFPRHPHKNIPVLIGKNSPLSRAEILAMPVAPPTGSENHASTHWLTGSLTDFLAACPGKQLLVYASGDGSDRRWLESAGYEVTTFDVFPGDFTDYVCDGHALPFADEQFEIVTSLAVFEHLRDPFLAASEILRVLKPGGAVVGSVAFLEPYHGYSYFHMSHLGLTEVLRRAGFATIQVTPGWSFAESLNGSFWLWNRIRPVRRITGALNRLKYALGLSLWRLAYRLRGTPPPEELSLRFCGSLIFKAVK
jgi:SAM-dependent methyltransferase